MKILSFKSGMTKLLCLLMATLLVFGMVACDDGDNGETTPAQTTTEQKIEVNDPQPTQYSDATVARMTDFMKRTMSFSTVITGTEIDEATNKMLEQMVADTMMPAYSVNYVTEEEVDQLLDIMEAYLDSGETLIDEFMNPEAGMTQEQMMAKLETFVTDTLELVGDCLGIFTPQRYGEINYDAMIAVADTYSEILDDYTMAMLTAEYDALKVQCAAAVEAGTYEIDEEAGKISYYIYDAELDSLEFIYSCVGTDKDAYITGMEEDLEADKLMVEASTESIGEIMGGVKTSLQTIGKETFADMFSISYYGMGLLADTALTYVDPVMGAIKNNEWDSYGDLVTLVEIGDVVTLTQKNFKYMADLEITEDEWSKFGDVIVYWLEYVLEMRGLGAQDGEADLSLNDYLVNLLMSMANNEDPDAYAEGYQMAEEFVEDLDLENYISSIFKIMPETMDYLSAVINSVTVADIEAEIASIQAGEATMASVVTELGGKAFKANKAAFLELTASLEKYIATDAAKAMVELMMENEPNFATEAEAFLESVGNKTAEDLYNAIAAYLDSMTDENLHVLITTATDYGYGLVPYIAVLALEGWGSSEEDGGAQNENVEQSPEV